MQTHFIDIALPLNSSHIQNVSTSLWVILNQIYWELVIFALKCIVSCFTCTNLYYIFHIIYEYLTITDMTSVKYLSCGIDNIHYRDFGNNHFNLYLRKKLHFHLNSTVILWSTLLSATAKYLRNCHTSYSDVVHSLL